jgi:hypothetical protein
MKDAAFQDLLTSVRQAGQIRRGTRRPSRATTFRPTDVQAVRAWRRCGIGSRGGVYRTGRPSRCSA